MANSRQLQIPLSSDTSREAGPFVKWVGGKRSIIQHLLRRVPKAFGTYWEPFAGGAALFFGLRSRITKAVLSDVNLDLIITYKVIQKDVEPLIHALRRLARNHTKDFYYEQRTKHEQEDPIHLAARLLYLNRTCYNGLWRVNQKGHFNVPMGRYENPDIVNETTLRECQNALQEVDLKYGDFTTISPTRGDFVYFDPPYHPTDSFAFTTYEKNGFTEVDQQRLCDFAASLHKRGVSVMLSNSDSDFIRSIYTKKGFRIESVMAPRMVNCKAKGRVAVSELLIRSYDV